MNTNVSTDRLEVLVQKVRRLKDGEARDAALELVQAVMDLHGSGLERMMRLITETDGGGALLDSFTKDSEVNSILLLHDLHPLEFETRVRRALEQPSLAVRGASVQIVSIGDGSVRLRVEGDATYEAQIRNAILEAAPDAADIMIETASAAVPAGFVPLTQLLAGRSY